LIVYSSMTASPWSLLGQAYMHRVAEKSKPLSRIIIKSY